MKVLMVGDIFGKTGLSMLQEYLPKVKSKFKPDFVIANGENAYHNGRGLGRLETNIILSAGVDCITLGNHTWANNDIFDFIDTESKIVRPANFPLGTPGAEMGIFAVPGGGSIAVISVMGRGFMQPVLDCPFHTLDRLLAQIPSDVCIFVDIHAETTSEKLALGWYLDGRVSAVVGTHTHVQTADERVLERGTGYLSDVGMVGPYDGVIGMDKQVIIKRYITGLPVRFSVAKGRGQFNAALYDINNDSKNTKSIKRIRIDDENPFVD